MNRSRTHPLPEGTARARRDVLITAAVAAAISGAPSTTHAVLTGRSPLAAARAAGSILGRPTIVRGAIAHAAVSVAWTAVLRAALPARHRVRWGAAAGLAIAALDLTIARHRFPSIAALPLGPQLADHALFGALVGAMFDVLAWPPEVNGFGLVATRRRMSAPKAERAVKGELLGYDSRHG